jgi:membrane fusion protein (multidrug efflux system)
MGVKGWIVIFVIAGVALIGGSMLWSYLQSYEDTDDAQIDGDIYAITSRISGAIKAVYVQDNQQVKAGQLLVELDPVDYQLTLDQAKAALVESQAQVAAARPNVPITTTTTGTTVAASAADVATARAQVAAAQAQVAAAQRDRDALLAQIRQSEADQVKTQQDLTRYRQLLDKDEISRQQFDQADAAAKAMAAQTDARRASAEAAARNVEAAQQNVQAAQAKLDQAAIRQTEAQQVRPQQIDLQTALVNSRQATSERQRAVVDQASTNLTYTKIFAPVDGVIGKKNAQPGQQVSPGQQMMAVVPLNNLWVTANFKETQLREMHPNQRVTIHVDAYDKEYEGYVESVAGASGARFSLLPPENATGNFVKVVQRVPVRIRIKEGQDPEHRLRPGMSVEPKVWLK